MSATPLGGVVAAVHVAPPSVERRMPADDGAPASTRSRGSARTELVPPTGNGCEVAQVTPLSALIDTPYDVAMKIFPVSGAIEISPAEKREVMPAGAGGSAMCVHVEPPSVLRQMPPAFCVRKPSFAVAMTILGLAG